MNQRTDTRNIVMAAMFAALTLVATSVLKISTPAFGYIHVGDTFVILSGIIMGSLLGPFAAGIGAGLADLLGGFAIWAPGTMVIKFLTALVCAKLYCLLTKNPHQKGGRVISVIISGIIGELVMVAGYFFYSILIVALSTGSFSRASLASALGVSVAEIPFNLVQGSVSVVLAALLSPAFIRIAHMLQIGTGSPEE